MPRGYPAVLLATLLAGCPTPRPCPPCKAGAGRPPAAKAETGAAFLEQWAATFRFRLGQPKAFALTPDGSAVLYLRSGPRSFVHDLYLYDVASRTERVLLTAQRILRGAQERLSTDERALRERMRLLTKGIALFQLSRDGSRLLVPLSGRLFVVARASGAVTELRSAAGAPPIHPRLSPDGKRVASVRDGDLYVAEVASATERRLTHRPHERVTNGLAEFVAQEEMGRYRGFWWSPDSTRLVYQQTDTSAVERLHILDPARPERPPTRWPYPRAGRANASVRLGLIPAAGGTTRWITWDRARYPYLATVKWRENAPLTLVVQNRRQTEMAVLTVDLGSGATRQLLVERDAAWLNIDPQMPRWLPDGRRWLWTTERGGGWQLELRDAEGKLLGAVTPPELGYRGLSDVDPERDEVFVRASPGAPREIHLFRLPLSGRGRPRQVSREPGHHSAVFARQHGVYVQLAEPLSGSARATVHRRDGSAVGTLRSVAERPLLAPRVQLLQVGRRGYQAAVVRPRRFDRSRRYPVIVYVYGGPGHQVVTARQDRYLIQQWLADQGFVVVSADGRGTPGRGRTWERAIRGSFIEVPLADQVEALQALGRQLPELDLSRVGILGWSFGGHLAAVALLERPDVFHAAVAGAPVSDWNEYDTHYTERYLGLPEENRLGYRRSSAVHLASRLRRPLLIVHGTEDDNVYFGHSIRLSDALFRAGRRHEFLPLTGLTHLVPDPLVTRRLYARVAEFFRRHLDVDAAVVVRHQ